MRADCEGCAGCCIGWQPVTPAALDHERRRPHAPLNDAYNLAPLTRDGAHSFVEAGSGGALSPRLWEVSPDEGVEVGGVEVATINGKPAFFVGMHKPPKPAAPFGLERVWLHACAFLDPEILQCRIHGIKFYPDECAEYPGHNLILEQEAECERVGRYHGGECLLDDAVPDGLHDLLLDPHALGTRLSVHPKPERLAGAVDHPRRRELTPEDRTEFVGVAVRSHPGSTEIDGDRASQAHTKALEGELWADEVIVARDTVVGRLGNAAGDAPDPDGIEVVHDTLETPDWDAVHDDG